MNTMPTKLLLCAAVASLGISPAAGADLVDRVVALVDESPILLSEVEAQLQVALQGLGIDPGDSARVRQLRDEILERQIDQRVLAEEARREGLVVDEAEVVRAVDQAIARNLEDMGSREFFEHQLEQEGISEEELRLRYADQARTEMLVSRLVQREIGGEIAVTSEEVREYYDAHRSELPQRQAAIHLQHVLIRVRPDSILVDKARSLASDVAGQITSGELSFADAARRYSDDPNGREGGDLFRIERGDLADRLGQAFEDALFELEPGVISAPLESPLGFHLMLVHERDPDGGWVRPSHILFGLPLVQADQARAELRARDLLDELQRGATFEQLAERHSDDPQSAERGGDLGWIPREALDPVILGATDSLEIGAASAPVAAEGAFHIFRVLGRESGREYAFDEIEEELADWVRNQKMEERYRAFVDEVKGRHYIERRAWSEN
jgi:peptidyl-prolyl cis-trans isomerase SurA